MLSSSVSIAAAVLLLLISAPAAAAGAPPMTIGMPGCNTTCGNVSVPYPFGMGPKRCYWPGFKLTCDNNGSKPPRLLLGEGSGGVFEVVDISIQNTTMHIISHGLQAINMSGGSGRWSLGDAETESIGASGVPYLLHPGLNDFILTGCNVQATLMGNRSLASGCASFCPAFGDGGDLVYSGGKSNTCSNIGCCQSTIQTASASYGVELKRLNYSGVHSNFDLPVHVLIAEVGWFDLDHNREVVMNLDWEENQNENLSRKADHLRVPVILGWALAHEAAVYSTGHSRCPDHAARSICKSAHSDCSVGDFLKDQVRGYSCQCREGYQGNPYLTGGCQDIKECDQKEKHFCFGDCEELPGSFQCRCPNGTHGNYTMPGGCIIIESADTIRAQGEGAETEVL